MTILKMFVFVFKSYSIFQTPNNDVLLESFSDDNEDKVSDEQQEKVTPTSNTASTEIRELLTRKVELEKRKRSQDLHLQRVKVRNFQTNLIIENSNSDF